MPPLPQSLETVGLRAFEEAFSASLTIESPHLTRTPALDPSNAPPTRTGSLGSSIFSEAGRPAVTREFTRIVIPREKISVSRAAEILGSPGGRDDDPA